MNLIRTLTKVIVISGTLLASGAWAKVSDFNSLINENISAQQELHGEIRKQVKTSSQAFRDARNKQEATTMVVESDYTNINTPTSARMLKFKKEKAQKTVSHKKQMDRVAQEFDDASSSL